jgi:DNA-binding beta-propeller fold protein YncE
VLYIADTANHRVLAIDATGALTMITSVHTPTGVAIAPDGSILIASWGGHAVFRLAADTWSTVAGTGVPGFAGDGGPATAAALNGPFAVAVDALGRIFIADEFNHRIRMIDAAGKIGTVLGAGSVSLAFPVGVATDTFGNIFVADQGHYRVLRIFRSLYLTVTP